MATSVTWDIACEYGGGVHCSHGPNKANFFGVMAYDRTWFDHDRYAVTIGGGFEQLPPGDWLGYFAFGRVRLFRPAGSIS